MMFRKDSPHDHAEVVDRARRKAIGHQADRAGIETVREIGSGTWFAVAEAVASYLAATRAKNLYRLQILPGTFCQQLRKAIYSRHKARRSASVHSQSVRTWLWTRTACNRAVIVSQLLNRDWPDCVEPIRSIYEPEEIQSLLKARDQERRVLYLCYLLTGLRDKEMRYLTWRDIDFRTQVIRVTRKPLYGFKPKNKEEREVPVPASLIAALRKYKNSKKPLPGALVFPNESGRPDKRHE